jgi:hypothetical protein
MKGLEEADQRNGNGTQSTDRIFVEVAAIEVAAIEVAAIEVATIEVAAIEVTVDEKLNESELGYLEPEKYSRATQTVEKVPKVYLTEAWKYTKVLDSHERTKVDFQYFPLIGTMRSDFHKACVPEGVTIDQLERESSFLRVLHESSETGKETMADNFDCTTRLQMVLGEYDLDRTRQTERAVKKITFAKDALCFDNNSQNLVEEKLTNKRISKDFPKFFKSSKFLLDQIFT